LLLDDNKSEAELIKNCISKMNNGFNFSESIIDIIPKADMTFFVIGERSGQLSGAIKDCLRFKQMKSEIRKALIKEMLPLITNLLVAIIMLAVVSLKVVPALKAVVSISKATGLVAFLFATSDIVIHPAFIVFSVLIVLSMVAVGWSLPYWCGSRRINVERYPVYKQYRKFQGIVWLINYFTLVAGSAREIEALDLSAVGASPWLSERIMCFRELMISGNDFSTALRMASIDGLYIHCPNELIIGDIGAIYGHRDSAHRLRSLLEEELNQTKLEIVKSVSIFGLIGTAVTVILMLLIVFASFEIQSLIERSVQFL
jgi:type II secretory pathway component PulF